MGRCVGGEEGHLKGCVEGRVGADVSEISMTVEHDLWCVMEGILFRLAKVTNSTNRTKFFCFGLSLRLFFCCRSLIGK